MGAREYGSVMYADTADRDGLIGTTSRIVRRVVDDLHGDGYKILDAFVEAGRRLGLTPRRVKSYYYPDDIWTRARDVLAVEAAAVEARFAEHLRCELATQKAAAEQAHARRALLEDELVQLRARHSGLVRSSDERRLVEDLRHDGRRG